MNNMKRILTIALCSILIVCTIPQFSIRSEAASTATYALYQTLLNLSAYLTTRGYSIAHEYGSSIPSITDLQTMTYENLGQRLFDISLKLNAFGATHDLPDLGDQFIDAMSDASFRGSILLSKQTRDLVDLWLYSSTSSGQVIVGSNQGSFSDYSYDPDFLFNFIQEGVVNTSVSFDIEILPLFVGSNRLALIPLDINDFSYNALTDEYYYSIYGLENYAIYSFELDGKKFNYYSFVLQDSSSLKNFSPFYVNQSGINTIGVAVLRYYQLLLTVPAVNIVSSQITDTSNSDLLTSTNTIASDGTVVGDTTIYLPDNTTLESAIDSYNNQSISLDEFLQILGINQVASDATVEEKEDALAVVVTPSEDYLWFTKTQWGADSLEETRKASASTRAEEDSLADSIANTANGGSDPEDPENKSRGKGLLALLLLGLGIWNTPIIAGDGTTSGGGTDDDSGDGSGDTSGYLAESIAGMAVAGSLVDDLFDSAGGSNGYGLIYTVGASFVIFSVIIGAANYFGALFHGSDTKKNIKASGKRSFPGKEKKGG